MTDSRVPFGASPLIITSEEVDILLSYVAEEGKLYQMIQGSPSRVPFEIPTTTERINKLAGVEMPARLAAIVEGDKELRDEIFDWLGAVRDRASGEATGLGGPYA